MAESRLAGGEAPRSVAAAGARWLVATRGWYPTPANIRARQVVRRLTGKKRLPTTAPEASSEE